MKRINAKQEGQFVAKDTDFEEVELYANSDAVEEDDSEVEGDTPEEEVNDYIELDDDDDWFEEEAESGMEDAGDFDTTTYYFREFAHHKLSSPERERSLTEAVKRGQIARRRLVHSRSLTAADRCEVDEAIEHANAARDELVRANVRLVISVARRYQNLGLPLMDLIQEGNIGLLRAIDRFEPARGLRLSTYATWWVRQAVSRAVANQSRAVRLPTYLQERLHKLQRVAQDLEQTLGRVPNDEELATHLAMKLEMVHNLRVAAIPVFSLDDSFGEEEDEAPIGQIEDPKVAPLDELVARRILHETLARALDELPARYALILRLRYGIGGYQPQTLEYVARKLGLSRERVRQIEHDAFVRLRMREDILKQRSSITA